VHDASQLDSIRDGEAWRKLAAFHAQIEPNLLATLLRPFPSLGPALRLGLRNLAKSAGPLHAAAAAWRARCFEVKQRAE
jgi:hypothetical protein